MSTFVAACQIFCASSAERQADVPGHHLLFRVAKLDRWNEEIRPPDLPSGDAPAWCLKDVAPQDGQNNLSMFRIPVEQRATVEPIVAASFAAGRPKKEIEALEYVLFEEDLLAEAGLVATPSLGDTPHRRVNELHLDVSVTARQAARLAGVIYGRVESGRALPDDIASAIQTAHKNGEIDIEKVKTKSLLSSLTS
jgi:hypothetical protein